MKKYMSLIAVALSLIFVIGVSNCIMDTKVMEVVLTDVTCYTFSHNDEDERFTDVAVVDYAAAIDTILMDNELSRADLVRANLVSATYEVTDFTQDTDWIISGVITVERDDISHGPATIVSYETGQSVPGALGVVTAADLDAAGVAVIDSALADYIHHGRNPILRFTVVNGDVVPSPSPVGTTPGPIIFSWEGCINVQVITIWEGDAPDPY